MKSLRWTLGAAALVLGVSGGSVNLQAQGVTTGAVAGTITDEAGKPVEGAIVKVVNRNSGFSASGQSRANGYFLVPNLESGGPYTVTVKRIGFVASERNNVVGALVPTQG